MKEETIPAPDFDLNGENLPEVIPLTNQEPEIKNTPLRDSSLKGRKYKYTDPVSWYNLNKPVHAKELLQNKGWIQVSIDTDNTERWKAPDDEGVSATFTNERFFNIFSDNAVPFSNNTSFTPFQILVLIEFKGNYSAAINWIAITFLPEKTPYIRIGVDYFKKINMKDRFGILGTVLKKWRKEEIKEDHGKEHLSKIPKFDNFCIEPDNFSYKAVIDNCYNLYHSFRHKESTGDCTWSMVLMEHVFGGQLKLGFRYMQCLYLHPDKMAPILVLISKERQTGKTTFLNWLNMIFGDNMVVINPEDLVSGFNSSYATSNIIAIEETLIEKSITVEKLKALATGKFISVNEKFISTYKLPFHGKIILSSNNEERFARIDEEEIRFFVRKLGTPKHTNHQIENDLVKEIPAFLHYLSNLPPVDFSIGRVPFSTEELANDSLAAVKKESKSSLYKDLKERFNDHFNNMVKFSNVIYATPYDIKKRWYEFNSHIEIPYIKAVLKNEYGLTPCKNSRYFPFGDDTGFNRVGMAYEFKCELFDVDAQIEEKS